MSLPTCPSCGQSVLEDNAVDCPFCGAAMDGSRGAKNTPRPKANPVANRPGARKLPPEPSAAAAAPSPASKPEPPKPAARPAASGRMGKPVVDEDDPFGIGSAVSSQAIQATLKPEKGRLHKVVCPMCDQTGFVPKTAIGKQVKCANEKCMVPIFTAPDPNETAEKKPTRLTDSEGTRVVRPAAPAKRNPMLMYGIVGAVLVVVTMVVISVINKPVVDPNLQKPIVFDPDQFGPDPEEVARQEKEKAEKEKAAAEAADPKTHVVANINRMILLARQAQLRDEALARQMTGDSFLRMDDAKKASLEFDQMIRNDRKGAVYRIEPNLSAYWRFTAAGDAANAKKFLDLALADVNTVPPSGRLGTEVTLSVASAILNEGQSEQALQAVSSRQLDQTNPGFRDQLHSTSWQFVASRSRDFQISPPSAFESLLWTDPLVTAVSANLALRGSWDQAMTWASQQSDLRVKADCLVLVADIAALKKAPADVYSKMDAAASGNDAHAIRVKAAVAAAAGDKARLVAVIAAMTALRATEPYSMRTSAQLAQEELPDRSANGDRVLAAAEIVRAAVSLQATDAIPTAMTRLWDEYAAWTPPAAEVRIPGNQMATQENAFKKQLASDLRISDDSAFRRTFQRYRRRLDRLTETSESARLTLLLLSSRIIHSGGASAMQQAMTANPGLRQEILLDELSGLLAVAVRQVKADLPDVLNPDVSLRRGRAPVGLAQQLIPVVVVANEVWANRSTRFADCVKALESGAGKELAGLRSALLLELLLAVTTEVSEPESVLSALLTLQNGIWREEGLQIAGRLFAHRSLEKSCDAWLSKTKVPSMEQICLLYGLNLGILDRPLKSVESAAKSQETNASATTQANSAP